MVLRTRLCPALVALLASISCSGEPTPQESLPHILVVTIDTLRADHLGCYGYFRDTSPVLDRLAEESLLFERCFTPVAQTQPSHASLFTGLAPHEHGVLANVQSKRTYTRAPGAVSFAEVLGSLGYDTAAFVAAEPLKRGSGIEAGFEGWWQPVESSVRAEQIVDLALDRYRRVSDRPTLTWVHLFDPHRPYDAPGEDKDRFQGVAVQEQVAYLERLGIIEPGTATGQVPVEGESYAPDQDRYDGEIRYADGQLGRLFAGLGELGLWDDLVVVVTSDHGEGLWQHGLVAHGHIWLETLHVPLLLRIPGRSPGRESALVETRDVLPTMAARIPSLARALDGWPVADSGRDALAAGLTPRPYLAQFPSSRRPMTYALVQDDWRLLHTLDAPVALFDLSRDPHELESRLEEQPDRAVSLKAHLDEILIAQRRRGADLGASAPRPAEEARLEALGEIGYAGDEED